MPQAKVELNPDFADFTWPWECDDNLGNALLKSVSAQAAAAILDFMREDGHFFLEAKTEDHPYPHVEFTVGDEQFFLATCPLKDLLASFKSTRTEGPLDPEDLPYLREVLEELEAAADAVRVAIRENDPVRPISVVLDAALRRTVE